MSASKAANECPQCGEAIPPEAPQGLCPKCLLREVSIPTESGKGPAQKPEAPAAGELKAAFPHLEILELIGRGGMGFVYKARQPKLDRFVALKILPQSLATDPNFTERFTREGRVLAKLSHPNIVTVHDFGQANGFFYLLMEFVNGVNLRQAMQAGRFTPAQALALVPDICEALQYAHTQGVLHRDIKPENILLDTHGRVKIADFGIAKLVGDDKAPGTLTSSGAAIGTPQYMAPEQIERPAEVDHRADIYSLGVVLYELLTGELPLGRFPPPSEKTPVNAHVDAVVLRALEKERERRYQSAGEVKTEVESLRTEEKQVPATPPPSWLSRTAILFLILGLIAWVASLWTTATDCFEWHGASILAVTGIALLTRRSIWRVIALVCNCLMLAITTVSTVLVVIGMTLGPFSWAPYPSGGGPTNPFAVILQGILPWVGVLAGVLVLLHRDVRAAFRPSRSIWPGILATATPILLWALPFLMWRFHISSLSNTPPEGTPANVTAPSVSQQTLSFTFRGVDIRPYGYSWERKSNYFQISASMNLLPQQRIRAWLRAPDGTTDEATTHQITYNRAGEKGSSYLFHWVLPESMGVEELTAAATGLRQWLGKPVTLKQGEPLILFRATNSFGGEYWASLEYLLESPPAPSGEPVLASVRVINTALTTNYGTTIVNVEAKLDAALPPAHVLECTATSLAGLPEATRVSFARSGSYRNLGCDWTFPTTFEGEDHQEALRQLQGATFIIGPGERRTVLAVTNKAGDVLHGYLKLVPPVTTK